MTEATEPTIEERAAAITDGIYFGLDEDVYHAVPRLSSHALMSIDVSPATFWKGSWLDPDRTAPEDEEISMARVIGRAYHVARLQPELFETLYVRLPDKADYGKDLLVNATQVGEALGKLGEAKKKAGESAAEQALRLLAAGYDKPVWAAIMHDFEQQQGDRIALKPSDYDDIVRDMERLIANPEVYAKFAGGQSEVSVFWTEDGYQMKARFDRLCPTHWVELKTYDNSQRKHWRTAINHAVMYNRYYMQFELYRQAAEAIRTLPIGIVGQATDEQVALIDAIKAQRKDHDLWVVFQEKGGIPNLFAMQFEFWDYPDQVDLNNFGAETEAQQRAIMANRSPTSIARKARGKIIRAKEAFKLYSTVYQDGEPWAPVDPIGTIGDMDFPPYWMENDE